jgi:hypothetical protein
MFHAAVIGLLMMIVFTLVFWIAPLLERIAATKDVDLDKVSYWLESITLASRHLENMAVNTPMESKLAWGRN